MTRNTFVLPFDDVLAVDEIDFLAHGGREMHCSSIDDCGAVQLSVVGSDEAIRHIARQIVDLHRSGQRPPC